MLSFGLTMCALCFVFTHKTAYEMRISDWSSDVCSSDLQRTPRLRPGRVVQALHRQRAILAPPTLAQGALVRAGQRPEAAVLQRRILEREPQADDAQRVGVEEGGILEIGRAHV